MTLLKDCLRLLAVPIASISLATTAAHAQDNSARHPDIEYLSKAIPEAHVDAFHTLDPDEFQRSLDHLNILWPSLGRQGAMIELARLTANLRDGHALIGGLYPFFDESFHRLPIQFYEFSDGLFIRAAHESLADMVGAKVLNIGGISSDEALSRVYSLVSHDNAMSQRSRAPRYLDLTEILQHLGLTASAQSVTLQIEQDGVVRDVTVKPNNDFAAPMPYGLVARDDWIDANKIGGSETALHLRHPGTDFWHHFDPETGLFFLQVNTFENEDAFGGHLADLKAALASIKVDKFILDIRNNQGGETGLVRDLTKVLLSNDNVNREGRFFVLIGRRTFSSGQLLVNALSQYSQAVFIGEPTGGSPIFFGNSRPNVHVASLDISIFLPTKVWMTTESDDTRLWHAPDLGVTMSSTDYFNNRDPALELAINFEGIPDLRQQLIERLYATPADLDGAVAYYRIYKADSKFQFSETEAMINSLGYRLLGDGKVAEAVAILSLNVEDFPDSANAHDSLGEAFLAYGQKEQSLFHYSRSLELDPSNNNARSQIASINAVPD